MMNYAVYTYEVIDGHTECHIFAYQITQDSQGTNGVALMTESDAQKLADSMTGTGLIKMVLPLEPDKSITAA